MYKKIIQLIIIILVVAIFIPVVYNFKINSQVDKNGTEKMFTILKGEGAKDIAANLKKENLISSKLFFEAYIWKKDLNSKLIAGEYSISPKMSIKEIAVILSGGKIIDREKNITIIEGWSVRDISDYFSKQEIFSGDKILASIGEPATSYDRNSSAPFKIYSAQYDFLNDKPEDVGLEGYLFPDTYRIYSDASINDVIKKMLDNFGEKLTPGMREEIKGQNKTIYEIITMASIVEKEVKTEKDMKIVSGIFWDRIKYGQALQSDATLTYALDDKKDSHNAEDLKSESPYNSYKFKGLPPGPICNPGLNAIKAAIYPTFTDYNYFLTRPDTGETVFSKTYDEHLRNKAKYLK